MTILELLTEKGFVEGTDFSLEGEVLTVLEKTRDVEQIIYHPESIIEIFDENGLSFEPPKHETVPAWEETVIVQGTYFEQLPSLEELKSECVRRCDVALLVDVYLSDKAELRDPENDSLNISDGSIHGWGFANIPCPSMDELYSLIVPSKVTQDQKKVNEDALKYLADTDWLIIRELDEGTPCPADVKAARAQARLKIIRQ